MATRLLIVAMLLALVCGPAHAQTRKEQSVTLTLVTATASASTTAGDTRVTFIFGTSFTGTVGGVAFVAADAPITVEATDVNFLRAIPYTCTAGTLRIIEVR
jgi:hypothetical protein